MLSAGRQSQVAGGLRRAVRQGSLAGSEGEKINLVIAVARAKDRARARGEKDKSRHRLCCWLRAKKKINLAVGAQWQSKRVGSELGRGFEVFLLTVKRDTGGANNQVSEKLGN